MKRLSALPSEPQFSLAYLLAEIALIAIALAAGRIALLPTALGMEAHAGLYCVSLIAGCGAAGGLCLRMVPGLIGGGVVAVSSIPLICLAISAASG